MKTCTKCYIIKDDIEFNIHKVTKDGLSHYCRECCKIVNKCYRNDAKTKLRLQMKTAERVKIINDIGHKICTKCGINKSLTEFSKDKNRKYGFAYWCKKCDKNKRIDNNSISGNITHKICTKCGINKGISCFTKNKTAKFGRNARCKECFDMERSIRKFNNIQYAYKNYDVISKKCTKCKVHKDLNSFYKNSVEKYGVAGWCKYCSKIYKKNHKRKKYKCKYNAVYSSRYIKNRCSKDVNFKISRRLRSSQNKYIKRNGGHKYGRTMELTGCSAKEARIYIEKQFKEGMTWKNYGFYGWHIDHIIPISSFDMSKEEDQRKCFHYTNLQPLWAKDNLSKGNKLNWKPTIITQ